jgi:dihydropyrimidinase
VDLVSTKPAKIFGLYPQKGAIQIGSDADLIIWDPNKNSIISAKSHHHNCDYSIYEGFEVKGSPYIVLSRGNIIFQEGEIKVDRGYGRYLYRNIGKYD